MDTDRSVIDCVEREEKIPAKYTKHLKGTAYINSNRF